MNLGRLAPTKQEVAGNSNQSGCPNTHSRHFVGPDVTLVPIVIFSLRAAGCQSNNQTSQQNEFFQGSSLRRIPCLEQSKSRIGGCWNSFIPY